MTKTEELLQAALYKIVRDDAFIGAFLQELTFKFNNSDCPTAAIGFNEKTQKFELWFNLDYFNKLPQNHRIGVLTHECLHFLHKHLHRWMTMKIDRKDRFLWNIAADMAINQYIPAENLGKVGIDVSKYKQADGTPFPKYQTMETYHELLQKNREGDKTKDKDLKDEKGKSKKDSHGNPIQDKDGKPYETKGTGNEGANKDELDKFEPMDEHRWEELSEEEKERAAREAAKLIQRTIEKTSYCYSKAKGLANDLLKDIDHYLKKLNYKQILRQSIKKTVMSQDRQNAWQKPNKRYGVYAPGSCLSRVPKINMYVDTSGSISYKELNEFLDVIDGFLKAGNKDCRLILWNTEVYYNKRYKLKSRLKTDCVKSGGTDPDPTLELIKKTNPDLSIILTDGFFDKTNVKVNSEVIWIISKQGNKEHLNKHLGKTIPLDGIMK